MELADLSAWPEMLGLGSGSHLTAIALAAASSLARTLELYMYLQPHVGGGCHFR